MQLSNEAVERRSKTHIVGECDMYNKEWGVLEETREIDECDVEKLWYTR